MLRTPSLGELVSSEPNWIVVTIIGAILGATINWWWLLAKYIATRTSRHPLEGEWHECHYTIRKGQEQLMRGMVIIKRGLKHNLVVRVHDESRITNGPRHGLEYRGHAAIERGLVLHAKCESHPHSLTMRFMEYLPLNPDPLVGLWFSVDFDYAPASGPTVLTRRRLSDEEAKALLYTHSATTKRTVRLRIQGHSRIKQTGNTTAPDVHR
ncbi:hypothetical protein Aph01nite_49500 [Acrocarpospora phusangensis]|uniref:Uncharacterized protein n=1 Tax=Acrocarpospora phusangensis TaxID=1070424 RepID=A0A919QFV6_9ACTN|nr:hypothetical protein [Acrocarpospora phusangensis]GIH26640.1 hypothetical protein Aph01nite_49500 [Acrocarpospora phusangensis]